MKNYAYFTLLATDNYFNGINILVNSFLQTNSSYPLNILVLDSCNTRTIYKTKQLCEKHKNLIMRKVKPVNFNFSTLYVFRYYNFTLNKFQMLNYKEYDKVIFLDADIVLLKNLDFIFDKHDKLYSNFHLYDDRGIVDQDGRKLNVNKMLPVEKQIELKKDFNDYKIADSFYSWGGVFMMNPHIYNFEDIIKRHQNKGIETDEFILDTIILEDEKLKNDLESPDNVFFDIMPAGSYAYKHKEMLHVKFWFLPKRREEVSHKLCEKLLSFFNHDTWIEDFRGLDFFFYEEMEPHNEQLRVSDEMQDYIVDLTKELVVLDKSEVLGKVSRLIKGNCLDDKHLIEIRKVLEFE